MMVRPYTNLIIFIPLICFYLFGTTSPIFAQNIEGMELRTVVIDPGHGGKDPGTVAPGGKNNEKQIALSVSLKLGRLIEEAFPDVKVLYTRKTDVFIPLSSRSDFANKNHADLFISIHVNAIRNNTVPSGSETFVMGLDKSESSLEVSKLENAVIAYEDDYRTAYQGFDPNNPESYIIFSLLQNAHLEQSVLFAGMVQQSLGKNPITINRGVKQGPMIVLWQTTMPAVLVELGFLTNAKDRAVLISEEGQKKLAALLFNSFKIYKAGYDNQILPSTSSTPSTSSIPSIPSIQEDQREQVAPTPIYRVQIFAISRLIPLNASDFKGYTDIHYQKEGNLYKYSTGSFIRKEEAMAYCNKVRKDFPQAFVVEQKNNNL